MARRELHVLRPAPCPLFPFDIRRIANQTVAYGLASQTLFPCLCAWSEVQRGGGGGTPTNMGKRVWLVRLTVITVGVTI